MLLVLLLLLLCSYVYRPIHIALVQTSRTSVYTTPPLKGLPRHDWHDDHRSRAGPRPVRLSGGLRPRRSVCVAPRSHVLVSARPQHSWYSGGAITTFRRRHSAQDSTSAGAWWLVGYWHESLACPSSPILHILTHSCGAPFGCSGQRVTVTGSISIGWHDTICKTRCHMYGRQSH